MSEQVAEQVAELSESRATTSKARAGCTAALAAWQG